MSRRSIVLLGAGGHARVVLDAIRSTGGAVLGAVAPRVSEELGVAWLGDDEWLLAQDRSQFLLVNAVGSTRTTDVRAAVFERMRAAGFEFGTVVHGRAIVAPQVELGEGAVVMAGAILQPGVRIGANVLVNTGAQLDHDCEVGAHSHVAPGVVCSGGVRIGAGVHLGVGAVLLQGVQIGAGALVGAGSLVIRDVSPGAVAYGHPAREVTK